MHFRVAPEIFERFPDAFIGVVAASGVANEGPCAAAEAELRSAEAAVRARLAGAGLTGDGSEGADLAAQPSIARWREAFRRAGLSPSKYKSSIEALLGRVLKGAELPAISPAVSLDNAVSLRHLLPVGAHGVDGLRGDIALRPARGDETFTPIGGEAAEPVPAGEIVYADDTQVRTRRWVWRQGHGARVTAASRTIFFPIDGWRGTDEAEVRAAAHELAALLATHLGARTAVSFIYREQPEVQVFEQGEPVQSAQIQAQDGAASGEDAPRGAAPAVHAARREPDAIDEVLTRGVVDVIVREEVEKRLRAGEKLRVKLGIDPTGSRLHIGRAVPLRKLRQFQQLGHTICLVIGDFTAQIGDASDKDAPRRLLSEREVYENMATYKAQIGRILDASLVEWSYNSDWLGQLRFKDVVNLATNFTVAQMLERENFALRYGEGKPIGLHEFFYPLMQGYDSYALKADLEVGGTDQLFNLMAGRPIQRSLGQRPQDIMTLPMIWGLDGRKMSTSEGNTILIEEPPAEMYGKVMSMGDEHIIPYFEVATEVPLREIVEMKYELDRGLNPMTAKKRLAYEITRLYHGDAGAQEGQRYFEELHQGKGELADADWPAVAIVGDAPRQVGALFVEAGLAESNGDARRVMQQGGLEIDGQKVTDFTATITPRDGMKLRRGKVRLARLLVSIE